MKILLAAIMAILVCVPLRMVYAGDCQGTPSSYQELTAAYEAQSPAKTLDIAALSGPWTAVRAINGNADANSPKYFNCSGLISENRKPYFTLLFHEKDGKAELITEGSNFPASQAQNLLLKQNVLSFQQAYDDLLVSYRCKMIDNSLVCMQIDNAGGVKDGYNQGYEFRRACLEPPGYAAGNCN